MNQGQDNSIAIIVAAGMGRRFGGTTPKQFLELRGEPLLLQTVRRFHDCQAVDQVCLVVPSADIARVESWCKERSFSKVQWVVAGGAERQDSVQAGFDAIPPCELVLVHDGARPVVSAELIQTVIQGAEEKGACVPGVVVQETLKKVAEGGYVVTTVDRNEYYRIQTPQAFRYTILKEALSEAKTDGFYGTDEAMLVERMGFPVCVVDGSPSNIKVTSPEDLGYAATIIEQGAC